MDIMIEPRPQECCARLRQCSSVRSTYLDIDADEASKELFKYPAVLRMVANEWDQPERSLGPDPASSVPYGASCMSYAFASDQ
jgi:hypothetical protein